MTHLSQMRRPLPSFDEWLADNGDGTRGDGFDAFVDVALRTQDQKATGLGDDETSFLRIWQGLCVAVVELCNIEARHGRTAEQIIQTMPRALAAAAVYATASVVSEGTPLRSVAKLLTEEFRHAAKVAADDIEASR